MPALKLRLLAIDGGGVRGLSSLIILEQLMETVDPESPPKPCDYFDMIGGTNTGGLIAIMLGRLRMSIDECIEAYLSLSDRIFQKKRHRVTAKGNVQGRFDSEELTKAVKEVLAKKGLQEDALLKDTSDNACKVFVCATSKQTSETVCLTSYKSPRGGGDLLNSVRIWEACRATSAASSFFDSISVGRYDEEFVDGATGANNPVWEVWNQAQLIWGPQPLEDQVKCLVSIGTGVPSLKPFRDDVFHIGETLVAIATETEQTAEKFRRDKTHLDDTGRYYRFNVAHGLEDIGLEETKRRKEIAAATRRYVGLQDVLKQMQACAEHVTERNYFGDYQTVFSIEGVPRVNKFVDRPVEMAKLADALLPQRQNCRQKIYILHGLGGIGKTQLAVEFVRVYHRRFSSVFWLDGRSEDTLKRSIVSCASRIPEGQISETSRISSASGSSGGNLDAIVKEVMTWLAHPNNTEWLLVFDNVDREYTQHNTDPDAYDVKNYLSSADHGVVLITTRLAKLEQLGDSQQLGKVDKKQAESIFQSWYKRTYDPAESTRLFDLLDGLPLAIAQAGAYLQQSGVGIGAYVGFYEHQWTELMQSRDDTNAPLQDYPDRSVWTTWTISYNAIRRKNVNAANLLLLWAFLDNKDLWHGLLSAADSWSSVAAEMLSEWIGDIASNKLVFTNAIQLLRNYSLIEDVENLDSFATHPVVHKWAYYFQGEDSRMRLAHLAVVIVGLAVPYIDTPDYWTVQRRLVPHADACSQWIFRGEVGKSRYDVGPDEISKTTITLQAIHHLGVLYMDQGKLADAEKIYDRALRDKENLFGPNDPSTLNTVHSLGSVYVYQGKLTEAEKMYDRARRGFEEALGHNHTTTLRIINNLGDLYEDQGKLAEAEKMYHRALRGKEDALGPKHTSTLATIGGLGNLFIAQGKLAEAEKFYNRALQGYGDALGPTHTRTLGVFNCLGVLYGKQGKLVEAQKMYDRALQGYEEVLGPKHTSTLDVVGNLGLLYMDQGKLAEAEKMYHRALQGKEEVLGPKDSSTLETVGNLGRLYRNRGNLAEAEKMFDRALQGFEDTIGLESVEQHGPALNTIVNRGHLYMQQREHSKALEAYLRALPGFQALSGSSSEMCKWIESEINSICSALDTNDHLGSMSETGPNVSAGLSVELDTNDSTGPSDIIRAPGSGAVEDTKKSKFSVRRLIQKFR